MASLLILGRVHAVSKPRRHIVTAPGDRTFLETAYPRPKDVADYAWRSRNAATGLVTDLPGGKGAYIGSIIEWPPSMRYGYDTTTNARTVVQALACADQELVARFAAKLGRTDDIARYQSRTAELRTALNERLLRADGVYNDGLLPHNTPSLHVSQQANSVPLSFGLVPAKPPGRGRGESGGARHAFRHGDCALASARARVIRRGRRPAGSAHQSRPTGLGSLPGPRGDSDLGVLGRRHQRRQPVARLGRRRSRRLRTLHPRRAAPSPPIRGGADQAA